MSSRDVRILCPRPKSTTMHYSRCRRYRQASHLISYYSEERVERSRFVNVFCCLAANVHVPANAFRTDWPNFITKNISFSIINNTAVAEVRTSEGGEAAWQFYVDVRFLKQTETCLRSFWEFAKCLTAVIDKQLEPYFLHYLLFLLYFFLRLFLPSFLRSLSQLIQQASRNKLSVCRLQFGRWPVRSSAETTFRCDLPGLQEKKSKTLPQRGHSRSPTRCDELIIHYHPINYSLSSN